MTPMAKSRSQNKFGGRSEEPTSSIVNADVGVDVRRALDAYMADFEEKNGQKAQLNRTIAKALKLFLKAEGFWPLTPSSG